MKKKPFLFLFLIFFISSNSLYSQKKDSISVSSNDAVLKHKKKFYQTGLFKATVVPAVLIGWGVSTIHDHGLYSSYDAYRDIHKLGWGHTKVDNYLQYAPYVELAMLNVFNIRCKNDFKNTALLIIKSEIIMNAVLWPIKHFSHEVRPDSMNPARDQSFPSGHTANAFAAASIIHKEFRHRSVWYGVGAYTIATSVGVMRMVNNRHWESDVFVGAGLGILSVHLAYLTHRYRWGRKCEALIVPTYNHGNMGFAMVKRF